MNVMAPAPKLRGNYTAAAQDYTMPQRHSAIPERDHATWRELYRRQMALFPRHAARAYREGLAQLDCALGVPDLATASARLHETGWTLVAVPGLIPEEAFFSLLASRKFPVTDWIRTPEEFDYVVEPDIFHDLFGHVPLLFNPTFANYMQAYGAGGMKASRLDACELLARLYWYTVEFGLIQTPLGLRAYGAGILSSAGELQYSLTSSEPKRLAFDLRRLMRSRYRIDSYQAGYFVINSFDQLFEATEPDFTPVYLQVREAIALSGEIAAGQALAGEVEFSPSVNPG